jgi:hypothetical protein
MWLEEQRERDANDPAYRWAVNILGRLQAMHAATVRQSKLAAPWTVADWHALNAELAQVPVFFFPDIVPKKGRLDKVTPAAGMGGHSAGSLKAVAVMKFAQVWSSGAIEHIHQCPSCGHWMFGNPNKRTCDDNCRQTKSRQKSRG